MLKNIHFCDGLTDDYLQDIKSFIEEWKSAADEILVQTSGSTGPPKTIRLLKSKVKASAKATGTFFNFQANQTALLNLSPNYIAGKLMLVRAIEFGMKLIVAPNDKDPLCSIPMQAIDFAAFVPYQLKAILSNPSSRAKYEAIKNVIIGGAAIDSKLENALIQLSNQNYATFGMTETITHFALRSISNQEDYFTCLPGISVGINEAEGLIIHKNEITPEIQTNDRVELLDDRRFKWLGRLDNIVNSAGIKISPELIEKRIENQIPDNRFYFMGRKSDTFGEELVLYIEGELNVADLLERLKPQMSKYELPKAVICIPKFEETDSGKVIRKQF